MKTLGQNLLPICGILGIIFTVVGVLNLPHAAYVQCITAGSVLIGAAVVGGEIAKCRDSRA
jgi:hypothetical protein